MRRNVAHNGSTVERHAERAARKASPWIERLARVGYVGCGVETLGLRPIGQLAYGVFMFVVARYGRNEPA